MTDFTGTTGTDILFGTAGDDVFTPGGTTVAGESDWMSGGDGADVYQLYRGWGIFNSFIIDDRGLDGALDTVVGLGAFFQSASLGYQAWGSALRVGDTLIIDTPGRPNRFHSPGTPAAHLEIIGQYSGTGVETLQAGSVTYNLPTGGIGTAGVDLMAGSDAFDAIRSRGGDDLVFANGGDDQVFSGNGNDTVLAGTGNDLSRLGRGDDKAWGGDGNDKLLGGDGNDSLYGEAGDDKLAGGKGNDSLYGGAGDDRLFGGQGQDQLEGGSGNDRLVGGAGGDVYRFDANAGLGNDVVRDNGSAASVYDYDVLEVSGLYHPGVTAGDAFARVSFTRQGADMLVSIDGGASTITVESMFNANADKFMVETFTFEAGYWTPLVFQMFDGAAVNIGDDRDIPYHTGLNSWANEILFGTNADDFIFGGGGTNFIWTGDGADTLIYKEVDPDLLIYTAFYGYGGGTAHDIVEDFNVTQDKLNFTEIAAITSLADLTVTSDAEGDAIISWNSGDITIADILIELRGVAEADVTADMFVFV